MRDYNRFHPEILSGEVFLRNTDSPIVDKETFPSARVGKVGYDIYGEVIQSYFPVFVSQEDYDRYIEEQAAFNKKCHDAYDLFSIERQLLGEDIWKCSAGGEKLNRGDLGFWIDEEIYCAACAEKKMLAWIRGG